MLHPPRPLLPFLLLAALGCAEPLTPAADPESAAPPGAEPGSRFDAATATALRGRVTWAGDVPNVPRMEAPAFVAAHQPGKPRSWYDHPHAPAIDAASHGVANAVVYLRGVDPTHARPWHHPGVALAQKERRLYVVQGREISPVGFVRRGADIEMVSRDPQFHALHLNGAAFFTRAFPDPDQPLRRKLTETGHVECSSAAGYFWMRAHLFVADHPYYARTDRHGHFVLEQVPPGTYALVCWLPNWVEQDRDRDPETALTLRLRFRPPVTLTRQVTVPADGPVTFSLRKELFER